MNFNLTHSIAILERTPSVLRTLLSGLPDEWTRSNEGPDTWSPFDVVGHLIDGEETDWTARLRIILSQEHVRKFEPFDRFRHLRTNKEKPLDELLARFAALRAKNLADVKALNLNDGHLRRTGEHPEFGTVTLEQLLATWVVHDLDHLAQISRVMAKQYSEDVGPWANYLSVLHR
ncbi:MAG: DinB family protein [Bacteroidetes bacterium]|nr:DinB family protein [Bacteroidota bacterium]MCW5897518.1 DinB family protein [Bacteroidota bacterium]